MLGALPGGVFNTGSVYLNPGDMLITHSDGVTECRNAEDEEFDMQTIVDRGRSGERHECQSGPFLHSRRGIRFC